MDSLGQRVFFETAHAWGGEGGGAFAVGEKRDVSKKFFLPKASWALKAKAREQEPEKSKKVT